MRRDKFWTKVNEQFDPGSPVGVTVSCASDASQGRWLFIPVFILALVLDGPMQRLMRRMMKRSYVKEPLNLTSSD